MSNNLCDIIIPTYDNPQYIIPCVKSIILNTSLRDVIRIIVVNNGSKKVSGLIPKHPRIEVIEAGKNLGWEGGLKKGLEKSNTEFVCFMNDDTYVPFSSYFWLHYCLQVFQDRLTAACGPTSNCVSGSQNVFYDNNIREPFPYTNYLIGFCKVVRRSHLDAVGGIDDTLPGGDDFDLSIRFRKAGYNLKIARSAFVYHHGFKTGIRTKGDSTRPGGWNSREMIETTNRALIRKHGFRSFLECISPQVMEPKTTEALGKPEKEVVRDFLKGEKWVELGCGGDKVDESVVGVDRVPKGKTVPFMNGVISQADVVGDVSKPIPLPEKSFDTLIAKHILEHCVDPLQTMSHWVKLLKDDGRIIISIPDQSKSNTILLNPEHCHAYTPESLDNLMSIFGMKRVGFADGYNSIAITAAYEFKNGNRPVLIGGNGHV